MYYGCYFRFITFNHNKKFSDDKGLHNFQFHKPLIKITNTARFSNSTILKCFWNYRIEVEITPIDNTSNTRIVSVLPPPSIFSDTFPGSTDF